MTTPDVDPEEIVRRADRDPHAVIVAALKAKAVRIAPPLPTLGIHDIDGAATAVVAALGLHAWTPPTPGTDDTRAGHGMIPGSHERPDGPECRCGAAWDRSTDRCTTGRDACERCDHLAEARPDDDGPDESLAMAVADVDQLTAEVERLTGQLAQTARERDDRGRVLQDVIKQRETAYRARDEARRERDIHRKAEARLARERDEARRERDKAQEQNAKLLLDDLAIRVLLRTRGGSVGRVDPLPSAVADRLDGVLERADNLARELKAAQGERVVSAIFGHHKGAPRPFSLYRRHDVSGVSGTGVVALGAQWPDGTTVIRWLGDRPSTVVWESMEHAEAVHGHAGATRFVWLSDEFEALAVQEERETRLRDGIERIAARCEHNARGGWTGMASTAKALRALLDGPTPAPNTTQPETIGWEVLIQQADGTWAADWDGETHATREDAQVGAADAAQAGYLARVARLVSDGPVLASSPTADAPAPGQGQDTTETQEAQEADRG